jgi:hypothetical protein
MLSVNQQENSSIMAEETYDSIKHMFNSYEYMVDGDFCTINKCETLFIVPILLFMLCVFKIMPFYVP